MCDLFVTTRNWKIKEFKKKIKIKVYFTLKPFQANVSFLYNLKTSENQRFSDVFRGYRNRILAWNGLKKKNTRNAPQIIQKISKLWTEKNDRHVNIITRYKARDNDIDRNQKAQSKPIFTIFETQGSIEVAEKDDLVINEIDKGGGSCNTRCVGLR